MRRTCGGHAADMPGGPAADASRTAACWAEPAQICAPAQPHSLGAGGRAPQRSGVVARGDGREGGRGARVQGVRKGCEPKPVASWHDGRAPQLRPRGVLRHRALCVAAAAAHVAVPRAAQRMKRCIIRAKQGARHAVSVRAAAARGVRTPARGGERPEGREARRWGPGGSPEPAALLEHKVAHHVVGQVHDGELTEVVDPRAALRTGRTGRTLGWPQGEGNPRAPGGGGRRRTGRSGRTGRTGRAP